MGRAAQTGFGNRFASEPVGEKGARGLPRLSADPDRENRARDGVRERRDVLLRSHVGAGSTTFACTPPGRPDWRRYGRGPLPAQSVASASPTLGLCPAV